MRCLVVLPDEGSAVLSSLTNKTNKFTQEIAGTRVYISLLPAYTSFLFSSCIIQTSSILISTSREWYKKPLSFQNTPDNLYNFVLSLWASFCYMQQYHIANTSDVDLFLTHSDGTKGQQQRNGERYGKDADIGSKTTLAVGSGPYKGFHLTTHPWAQ